MAAQANNSFFFFRDLGFSKTLEKMRWQQKGTMLKIMVLQFQNWLTKLFYRSFKVIYLISLLFNIQNIIN